MPPLPPGAVLYTRETQDRDVLARFAAELANRGWQVGGIVQKTLRNTEGVKIGMDAVEVDSGRHISIGRPTPGQIADGSCALDKAGLAESTEALRRATDARVDLVVIEKFGEQEQKNQGLAQEILMSMAEGLPTLVAVPVGLLEDWNLFSGGLGVLLPSDEAALWRWWGPHRLYRDLVLGVSEGEVRRVVAGPRWILVEGPDGVGLAPAPQNAEIDARALEGTSLRDLAGRLLEWDRTETALGLAAVNAHYNRNDMADGAEDTPPLDDFDGPVTVVGNLPYLARQVGSGHVVRSRSGDGALPRTASRWLLPEAEGVLASSTTLADKTLPGTIEAARMATVVLVGPATPLTRRLHSYGLNRLAGLIVTDADGLARAVADGAGARELAAFGRTLTLSR